MRDKIIEKLKLELNQEITSERQVVYILVEIRKLIEKSRTEKYKSLKFYIDWLLHPEMNRVGAAELLKRFDAAHPMLMARKKIHEIPDLSKLIAMDSFKNELKEFLLENGLNTRMCGIAWPRFLKRYASVIEDLDFP